jgi:hypothetical protein
MVFGAIFVVTVLLVAMPGHHAPVTQSPAAQQSTAAPQSKAMPGMDMGEEKTSERAAVQAITCS